MTALAGAMLSDGRRGKNTRHVLVGLLRQSVFGRLAGYEDVNDAERLAHRTLARADNCRFAIVEDSDYEYQD